MGRPRKPIPADAQRSPTFGKGRKQGRQADFKDSYIAQVEQLVRDHDYTDAQIAAFLGKDPATIWRWKMAVPDFGRAFHRGEQAQIKVLEAAMFSRATGYSHEAVKIFPPRVVIKKVKGKKNAVRVETKPIIVKYVEHFAPDPQAAFRLLEARDPKRYSAQLRHIGDPTQPVEFLMVGRIPKEGDTIHDKPKRTKTA